MDNRLPRHLAYELYDDACSRVAGISTAGLKMGLNLGLRASEAIDFSSLLATKYPNFNQE